MKKIIMIITAAMLLLSTAVISAEDTHQLIYGTNTEITGDFAPGAWWSNGSMDNMIRDLTNDYDTVVTDQGGAMVINQTVCESLEGKINEDGSKTFTVRIKDGLLFNNGEPVTIKDFVWETAFFNSPIAEKIGIMTAGNSYIVGGKEYYDGTASAIKGLRIPDDHTIQITISADYVPNYFDLLFASFTAFSMKYWLGEDVDIRDDGEGVYFTGLNEKAVGEHLNEVRFYAGEDRVTAGPYSLVEFDPAEQHATLVINQFYQGNFEGQKPSVEKIVIVKANWDNWSDELKTGSFNFVEKLSSGNPINKAMELIGDETVRDDLGYGYDYVQFDRAGYAQLLFQCDFGPTQFLAVRHAIALLMDREEYIKSFIQGWGNTVNGPYGTAMWMAKEAEEWLDENLDPYEYDPEKAVELLIEDGWIYDENGSDYTEGIRYKKVTEEEAGSYVHTKQLADGTWLMGLEIEWCGTEGTGDLLSDMLVKGEQTAAAGMKINENFMPFSELLNYYYRNPSQGEQYSVPTYGIFNLSLDFAPQFSMAYNFSENSPRNVAHLYDKELDQLSIDMIYNVESGDDEAYLEIWKAFVLRWNELLPELPLYSNIYVTIFPDWLEGFEESSYWDFDKAILYASIRE